MDNISQTIDSLRAVNPNVTVLVAQIIPSTGYITATETFNALLPAMVSAKTTAPSRVVLVDQYTGFSDTTDTDGGIHPNNTGDVKMATQWYSALQTVL